MAVNTEAVGTRSFNDTKPTHSLIIPVYKNQDTIPHLLPVLDKIYSGLQNDLEVIFVVDGSPDDSYTLLKQQLPQRPFCSRIIVHSRNFGSFAAIRSGLQVARGDYMAVMAADLQEPPELILDFFNILGRQEADITIGQREQRDDPKLDRLLSNCYWRLYKRLVIPEIPAGGVDVFGCTNRVCQCLLRLDETNSSLVGLLFWVGFRRVNVPYQRRQRVVGSSGWTLGRKIRYFLDSTFAFTDLPINLMLLAGSLGVFISVLWGLVIFIYWSIGWIEQPGYAATMLGIFFFMTLLLLSNGIIGSYVWRAFENTKRRPTALVMLDEFIEPTLLEKNNT